MPRAKAGMAKTDGNADSPSVKAKSDPVTKSI